MPGNIATPPTSITDSWPEPNYIDPERQTWLPAVAGTLHAFSTVLVVARLWLRSRKTVGGLGFDDALLIPAWLFATAGLSLVCYASNQGFCGIHVWDVRPELFWQSALNAWLNQFFFLIGTCCLKVSVLLFCLRMVKGSSENRWRYVIMGVIAFTVAYSFAIVVVLLANCTPTKAYWKAFDYEWASRHDYKCSDTRVLNPLAGIFAIVSDIYSIAIPCVVCWKLRLSWKQRLGLNALFCASILAVGAAGGRTWALYRVGVDYDASWHAIWVFFWSSFEYELGLICTCIPTLRALFRDEQVRSRVTGSRRLEDGDDMYLTTPSSFKSDIPRTFQRLGQRSRGSSPFADDAIKRTTVISMHSRDASWLELDE